MKISSKRLLERILLFLVLLLHVLFTGEASIVDGRIESAKLNPPSNVNHRDTDIPKILSLLDDKAGSPKVIEKVKTFIYKYGKVSKADILRNVRFPSARITPAIQHLKESGEISFMQIDKGANVFDIYLRPDYKEPEKIK